MSVRSSDAERPGPDRRSSGETTGGAGERLATPEIRVVVEDVWGSVLKHPSLDANSSFFRLGGTSIAAMRACARVSERIGRHVPVRMMFEHDGLERFVSALDVAVEGLPVLNRE